MHGRRVVGASALFAVMGAVALIATPPVQAVPSLTGRIVAWGSDGSLSGTPSATSPVLVPAGDLSGKTAVQVSSASHHACALDSDGLAYCWGSDSRGALGNGGGTDSAAPAAVFAGGVLAGKTLTQVIAGDNGTSCALDTDGHPYCWGSSNGFGMLGTGVNADSEIPVAVAMGSVPGGSFSSITLGAVGACGLAGGQAYCWGGGSNGEMGNGLQTTVNPAPTPVDVTGVLAGKTLTAISGGSGHTCVLDSAGQAYCWGYALLGSGELGSGSVNGSLTPVAVDTSGVLAGKTLVEISATRGGCAVDDAGQAYCWGPIGYGLGNEAAGGPLGTGTLTPVAVDMSGVLAGKHLATIDERMNVCALDTAGAGYCWGSGGLGNGTNEPSAVPVAVDTTGVLAGYSLAQIVHGNGTSMAIVGAPAVAPVTYSAVPNCGLAPGGVWTIEAAPLVRHVDATPVLTVTGGPSTWAAVCWGTSPTSGSDCEWEGVHDTVDGVEIGALEPTGPSGQLKLWPFDCTQGSDLGGLQVHPGEDVWIGWVDQSVLGDPATKPLVATQQLHYDCAAVGTAAPRVSVGSASVMEGDTGKDRTVQFAVTLSEPATTLTKVGYRVQTTSSAEAPYDLTVSSGYVTFKPSATLGVSPTTQAVATKIAPDLAVEGDETFSVTLTGVSGTGVSGDDFVLGGSAADVSGAVDAVGTILDDDPTSGLEVSVGDASIWEGDTGQKVTSTNNARLWVNLSAPATTTVTVKVTVSAGTATAGSDFKKTFTTTYTFKPGQWQRALILPVLPDLNAEGDETVTVTLSNPSSGLTVGRSVGTVTILNDD